MVEVIMATYNGGAYIKDQIDSILNQTYKNIKIIIRDDGSTDNTIDIIKKYIERYKDKIIFVQDDVKCGSSKSNFMQLMRYTSADYVMFSDQDDYWLPKKVEITLNKMLEIERSIGKDKPILIFASYKSVDGKLKDIKEKASHRQVAAYKLGFSNLLVQNYINGCLSMLNRKLVDMMGNYDERILMHDWWAALIASGAGKIEHVDEIVMLYRQHDNNVVGSVDVKSLKYRLNKLLDPKTKEAKKYYLRQAQLLYHRCGKYLYKANKIKLKQFIKLYHKKKYGRIKGLIKGNYLKSDIVRVLGQLWYI